MLIALQVGSADSLYNHQSTFMVEMLEVADILNQATPRSFVSNKSFLMNVATDTWIRSSWMKSAEAQLPKMVSL